MNLLYRIKWKIPENTKFYKQHLLFANLNFGKIQEVWILSYQKKQTVLVVNISSNKAVVCRYSGLLCFASLLLKKSLCELI